jgi:hypothetical protein
MRLPPVKVTATPGSGAFWSSVTTPRMAPVSRDWEKATGARRRSRMAMNATVLALMRTSFPNIEKW